MYNSVAELHIGVDLTLQQLNSNRKQVVKPEEKDWFLNSTMLQVINNHIDPNAALPSRGSDSGQRVVDYLNVLKVRYSNKPVVFLDSDNLLSKVPLPSDYYRKSRIDAKAVLTIKETDSNPLVKDNDRLLQSIISFNDLHNGSSVITIDDYITSSKIRIGNTVIFDATAKSPTDDNKNLYDFSNIVSLDSKFMMIATILEVCNSLGWVSAYWEQYNGSFSPNSFIFVVDSDVYFNKFGTNINESTNVSYETTSVTYTKSLEYVKGSIVEGTGGKSIPCRVVSSEEFNDMRNNSFFSSSYVSINTVIEDGNIIVANTEDFRVVDIDMVYYRKPKLINYKTNQNCEIVADDFKVQLVNLTAQKINAFIDDGNYQKMLSENMLLL